MTEQPKDSATILLPAISDDQVGNDLYWLTEQCAKAGKDISGGLLGGEFGYGAYVDNDVFMMHPFCWCERDDCEWCRGCECPEESWLYYVEGKQTTHRAFLDAWDPNDPWRVERHIDRVDELLCGYCDGSNPAAPNFLHKPSGTNVYWYKYIGRSMEVDIRGDWRTLLAECAEAIK